MFIHKIQQTFKGRDRKCYTQGTQVGQKRIKKVNERVLVLLGKTQCHGGGITTVSVDT